MFKEIFRYEFRYHFRRPVTYIAFAVFFLLGFWVANIVGGAFENTTSNLGKVNFNTAYVIHGFMVGIMPWFILFFPAFISDSIARDFKYNMHSLYFTKPITKWGYLGGRFTGSVLVVFFLFFGIELGFLTGTEMPWLEASSHGPLNISYYITDLVYFILPNILFLGSVLFCLTAISRNLLLSYVICIFFIMVNLLTASIVTDIDNEKIAALLDPFCQRAFDSQTNNWTISDKNSLDVSLTGVILYNRLIWLGAGLLIFLLSARIFSFRHQGGFNLFRKKSLAEAVIEKSEVQGFTLPKVKTDFSPSAFLKQFVSLTGLEFRLVVRSIPYIIFLLIGVFFFVIISFFADSIYDTSVYPVTSRIMTLGEGAFGLGLIIFTIFYSGELVWRERSLKINQVYDALPFPGWVAVLSKITALVLLEATFFIGMIICGMTLQTVKGYYNYEIGLYLKEYFILGLPNLALFTILAVLVQTTVNQKFLGYTLVIVIYAFNSFSDALGLHELFYKYSRTPGAIYSDMNTYGSFLIPNMIYKVYWSALGLAFALASNMFWVRGMDTSIRKRWLIAKERMTRTSLYAGMGGFALFGSMGGYIFYQTHIKNPHLSNFEQAELNVRYEKDYKKYENLPQPKITDVMVYADFQPSERTGQFHGFFRLKNKSETPITNVHLTFPTDADGPKFSFSRGSSLEKDDSQIGYRIYHLAQPLQPGDTMSLFFDLRYWDHGLGSPKTTPIVQNGTFVNNKQVLPAIGYNPGGELNDDNDRKKHGLKPKETMPAATDAVASKFNFIARDADWINFEAIISTSPDQVAMAPGYLQKEWTENGKRYFHYKMDSRMLNFYSLLSARYQKKEGKWHDVPVQVYYHKAHDYNVDGMIEATKAALEYYSANFGPYQHKQVRILEFPRYASFAQSFPNTIPFSEAIGFIAKVNPKDPEDVDYPFYVTAHEVAHQWWGHQVVGAASQGSAMLSETMSQYSALMVLEKKYGRGMMNKFLKYEMDKYLKQRSFEMKREMPLQDIEFQSYVYYNKGSVMMYALRDYIGEEKLNAALRKYLEKVKQQEPPYTNTRELMTYLRAATPDSLQYILTDNFEKITLYENKVNDVKVTPLPGGKYKVRMELSVNKVQASQIGKEENVPCNDYIEVAVMTKGPNKYLPEKLFSRKLKLHSGTQIIEVTVHKKPEMVGLDPDHLLIDKNLDDNTKSVDVKPAA